MLPLPQLALDIIEAMPKRVGREFLFGERAEGLTGWHEAKRDLDKRVASKVSAEWRLHDLRRSTAIGMADLGVQPHIIEAALNHFGGHRAGVAGTYNRSSYEKEVRAAMVLWADHVASIVDGGERKIIPCPQARRSVKARERLKSPATQFRCDVPALGEVGEVDPAQWPTPPQVGWRRENRPPAILGIFGANANRHPPTGRTHDRRPQITMLRGNERRHPNNG